MRHGDSVTKPDYYYYYLPRPTPSPTTMWPQSPAGILGLAAPLQSEPFGQLVLFWQNAFPCTRLQGSVTTLLDFMLLDNVILPDVMIPDDVILPDVT